MDTFDKFISDIDALVPEQQFVTLTEQSSGKKYKVNLFMPGEVGLLYLENEKIIQKLFQGKFDEKTLKVLRGLFELMFLPQFDFMTEEWCKQNIDAFTMTSICVKMAKPLLDYLKTIGISVMPEKKPIAHMDSSLPQ